MLDTLQLFRNAGDLLARHFALPPIQLRGGRPGQPPVRTVHDGGQHLQIAQQFGSGLGWGLLLRLSLRFEEQLGFVQNAPADRG